MAKVTIADLKALVEEKNDEIDRLNKLHELDIKSYETILGCLKKENKELEQKLSAATNYIKSILSEK